MIKNNSEYALTSMLTNVDVSRLKYDQYVLPVWQKLQTVYDGEEYLALIVLPTEQSAGHLDVYNTILEQLHIHTPRFFEAHPIISLERDDVFSLDFIKTDGALKIIVSGNQASISAILEYMDSLEQDGLLLYGHTISKSSIITYVIKESADYMAGLLDLDDGGYVAAAQELKRKMG